MNLLDAALDLADNGWPVLPLGRRSKLPRIPKHPECKASGCSGGCGRFGHGVKDATTDRDVVRDWFTRYPDALVGAQVPATLFALDVDPRHGGHHRLAALEAEHGPLPTTLTVWSGRGDGGRHLYWRRPAGKLTEARLKAELRRLGALDDDADEMGLDLKAAGYCVMPPSPHPATGEPYRWEIHGIAEPPAWLTTLLRPAEAAPLPPRSAQVARALGVWDLFAPAGGVADDFTARNTWADVLEPHGWRCSDPDGDRDGARWRHPAATTPVSATVRHGCLFVYSTNTPFEATTAGDRHGYTRFRAFAVLNHAGNLSAAARSLLTVSR